MEYLMHYVETDSVRDMQSLAALSGALNQSNPMQNQDMNKVFKAEIDNLELSDPKFITNDVEIRVLKKYNV